MTDPNPKADFAFDKATTWREAMLLMRQIALESGLVEEVKWGWPCYTRDGANIVLIHTFKDYAAYMFFKGVLMKDEAKILIQQTENVQDRRQIRFTSAAEVAKLDNVIRAYIAEAIALEAAGAKVTYKTHDDLVWPEEFQTRLDSDPALAEAFARLTPGRRKGWHLRFTSAKQARTRETRVDAAIPRILAGKGPDDPE